MSWNYRVFKKDGFYSLCEVYYDNEGNAEGYTEAIDFKNYSSVEDLIQDFELALKDAKTRPLFIVDSLNDECSQSV